MGGGQGGSDRHLRAKISHQRGHRPAQGGDVVRLVAQHVELQSRGEVGEELAPGGDEIRRGTVGERLRELAPREDLVRGDLLFEAALHQHLERAALLAEVLVFGLDRRRVRGASHARRVEFVRRFALCVCSFLWLVSAHLMIFALVVYHMEKLAWKVPSYP